jgi:hypothetical protein
MTKLMLVIHILGGGVAVLAGYMALFARKGGWLHRKAGLVFVAAMVLMGVGATYVGLARDLITWTGGITTIYLVTTALLTVRRKDASAPKLDAALMVIPLAFGLNALRGGIETWSLPGRQFQSVPAVAMFMSAVVLLLAFAGDARVLLRGPLTGHRRIARHLWRMCYAAFSATGSFFLVASRVPEPIRWAPLRLVLAFLPVPLMFYWLWRVRRKKAAKARTPDAIPVQFALE